MIKNLKSLRDNIAKQDIATQVRVNARDFWLASLGAFAVIQNEGRKAVSAAQVESVKVFNALVKQGTEIESNAKKAAMKQAETVTDKTVKTIDKLEHVFQDRVSRSLSRLGIPSNEDLTALAVRVEYLNESVKALAAAKSARRSTRKAAARA